MLAAVIGDLDIMKIILEYGASVDAVDSASDNNIFVSLILYSYNNDVYKF